MSRPDPTLATLTASLLLGPIEAEVEALLADADKSRDRAIGELGLSIVRRENPSAERIVAVCRDSAGLRVLRDAVEFHLRRADLDEAMRVGLAVVRARERAAETAPAA